MDPTSGTIAYYDARAVDYAADTIGVELPWLVRFAELVDASSPAAREDKLVLDLGCGSGRDAARLARAGFRVEAVDGSPGMVAAAREATGIDVGLMRFDELDARSAYDGIWACASLLHVGDGELPGILGRCSDALKPDGIMYASFKHGDFSGVRGGRFFRDWTPEALEGLLSGTALRVLEGSVSDDARGRGCRWLNVFLVHRDVAGRDGDGRGGTGAGDVAGPYPWHMHVTSNRPGGEPGRRTEEGHVG